MDKSGITLVALITTIIVLLILASIATYSGIDAVRSAKLTAFTTELKIMQTEVNNLYDEYKTKPTEIGKAITGEAQTQFSIAISSLEEDGISISSSNQANYRYFDQETIQSLGIEGVEEEFFVNTATRSIISYSGLDYENKIYYTLEQLPNGLYNVDYEEQSADKPTFEVAYEALGEDKIEVSIFNIQYEGYINKWQVEYKKTNQDYWNISEDLKFIINEDGIYKIKIANNGVESEEKEVIIATKYNKESLLLHYDAINNTGEGDENHSTTTTIWKDLSGNNNDGEIKNLNNTEESEWKDNYLKFDGVDDTVDTGLNASTTFTYKDSYTLEIVFNMNTITAIGSSVEKKDSSVIFGALSWCGYGIHWETYNGDTSYYLLSCGHRNLKYPAQPRISTHISNINQKNIVTQICDVENKKLSFYLNGKLIGISENFTDGDYHMAEQMENISISKTGQYSGDPRITYSDMNVYSARIYDRALTEEEVIINHCVDKNRFNIE